ncbi:MAG TPA: LPXTG cell wall anchor domain-containing protein [Draconibacterium sp.]|nr:LPXTG cell wall anchor domain-containing protein [Draconibacterium sp.]
MKKLMATVASIILSLPFMAVAQEGGTYIDSLNVQDSSYMEQDLLAGTETASSGNTTIIIIVAVVIIAVAAFVILKKKKK